MSTTATARGPLESLRASLSVFVTLGGGASALTLLFLGMRAVMEFGGTCATGGPYVIGTECPYGIPLVIMAGTMGGFFSFALYIWTTWKHHVPSLAVLAWPALFLSQGWNFLEFGIDPPGGGGPHWGLLVCAIFFALMGGGPLIALAGYVVRQFTSHPAPAFLAQALVPTPSHITDLRRAHRVADRGPRPPEARAKADERPESLLDTLERLREMHQAGALSDREFEAAKQRVLNGST